MKIRSMMNGMSARYWILSIVCFILFGYNLSAQISPGDLSKAHSGLEGVSNCTKCHSLGNKVTRTKCLDCHQEIRSEILDKKGYHSTAEVGAKECFTCHNEHHGLNFQLIRFEKAKFDHRKVGFELKGKHALLDCRSCHQALYIKNPALKKRTSTFLGLSQSCLNCHGDFHKGAMSSNCSSCHGFNSFKGATGFNHDKTKFPLLGQHKNQDCAKCHKPEMRNGVLTPKYKGIAFANCTACHKDVHENRFGQNCKQCHTESSFHNIKSKGTFNHDDTGYKLEGKHVSLACTACHKSNYTTPIRHEKCSDCHTDYHKKEFAKNGVSPDCQNCHTTKTFTETLFTIEKHNQSKFSLEGAHLATPCFSCHKTGAQWKFKNMGTRCVNCHQNKHKGFIQEKYMPNEDCQICHRVSSWKDIKFDHAKTGFELKGVHSKQSCSVCHYSKDASGKVTQRFIGMKSDCSSCHKDSHAGQFDINGKTDCTQCHGFNDWKENKFDHNTSRFKLNGAHLLVKCEECHKEVMTAKGPIVKYKFNSFECSDCHH